MATSSILDHITINDSHVLEDYIKSIEDVSATTNFSEESDIEFETNPSVLRNLMLKGIENWGRK